MLKKGVSCCDEGKSISLLVKLFEKVYKICVFVTFFKTEKEFF